MLSYMTENCRILSEILKHISDVILDKYIFIHSSTSASETVKTEEFKHLTLTSTWAEVEKATGNDDGIL